MDNNQYLIPANSKKSMLILGFFNPTDLIIFLTGLVVTFIFLITIKVDGVKSGLFVISPGIIGAFLVLPIPQHHNIRTFFINVYTYYTNRRTYYWKGWCVRRGEK